MNKNLLINVLVFALGASVGYFFTKKYLEDTYAEYAQEEIDHMRQVYTEKRKELVEKHEEKKVDNATRRTSPEWEKYEQAKVNYGLVRETKPEAPPVDEEPEECSEDSEDTEEDDAGFSEEEMKNLFEVHEDRPYLIECEQFADTHDHFEKITLYYFHIDDVLADENEEIVDDVDSIIGYESLNLFDTQTTIWVRNEQLSTDYEVISVRKSYSETVYGEPVKPAKHPIKRRSVDEK